MTKFSVLFTVIFALSTASAVTFEVLDPCMGRPKIQTSEVLTSSPFPSVGHYSVAKLQKLRTPFTGDEVGLSSIFNTPIGDAAVDVVNAYQMFAYGWCYQVNGVEPGQMAHQVQIKNNSDRITWFFAYTEMKNGKWLTMCEPAYKRPLKTYCQRNGFAR